MSRRGIIGLFTTLSLTVQLASGQLEPDCNPLQADCEPKKALSEENYFVDFTKQSGPPSGWTIANHEVVDFTPNGAEFTYGKKGDALNMWTDFYMLGGRYDVEMKIAPGQGVISSAVLWSDIQDEIDYEFSGNQFGKQPFPPQDGMWSVETNTFSQGKGWDGAATYQEDAFMPAEQFHKYSVEWDENQASWYVDDKVIRSIQAKDTPSGFNFPQSPMKLQLGVWGGGDPDNSHWTIEWAGGEIDMNKAPYTMYVKSVNITNKYPAGQYKYTDKSGSFDSIEKVSSQKRNTDKIVKDEAAVDGYPVSQPESTTTEANSYAATSIPSQGYPTSNGYPTYEASSPSVSASSSAGSPNTYPAASPSSSHSSASSPAEYPTYEASSRSSSHLSSISTPEGYPATVDYPTGVYSPTSNAGSSSAVASSSSSSLAESPVTYSASSVSSVSHVSPSSSRSSDSSTASRYASSSLESQSAHTSAATSAQTAAASTSGYPVSSLTSSRGVLSNLSSFFLGTTSTTSAHSESSGIKNPSYPTFSLSSSDVISVTGSGTGEVSSSISASSHESSSGYQTSSGSVVKSATSSSRDTFDLKHFAYGIHGIFNTHLQGNVLPFNRDQLSNGQNHD
ncbi:concanavalin A-like lectin/glucanase domain-containing protein [Hypoxylon sp. FL1284]|nr:concanavalin A-like lectin/glucanase domain-containing protein [Hypoxylon sp. FL1284]